MRKNRVGHVVCSLSLSFASSAQIYQLRPSYYKHDYNFTVNACSSLLGSTLNNELQSTTGETKMLSYTGYT